MTAHARYTAEVVTVAAERLAEALKNALQCDSLPMDARTDGRTAERLLARFWRRWTRTIQTNHFGRATDAPTDGGSRCLPASCGRPSAGDSNLGD